MRHALHIFLVLSLGGFVGCADVEPTATDGVLAVGAGGKADQSGQLSIVGDNGTIHLDSLPISVDDRSPLRATEQRDLRGVAALFDETFGTNVLAAVEAREPTKDDVRRAMMFASAHESEVRDDVAVVRGVEWTVDDLRAAYALGWLDAPEELRVAIGDGEEGLNAAVFHLVFTQLLDQGFTVVRGSADVAGAVYTGFEIQGDGSDDGATGPRSITQDFAERIAGPGLVDAHAYYSVYSSIRTTTGFGSERYVLATDEDGDLVAGYWAASNDVFPPLLPSRLWIAPERPTSALVDFSLLDELTAAFDGAVPAAEDVIYAYDGPPVSFTESGFFCAEVAMQIEDRFRVGDITVRAAFSAADGGRFNRDLEIKLFHAPPGNGPSLVTLAEDFSAENGEWWTEGFNFEGSESASWSWELRVCDTTSSRGDEETLTGFVDSFEIEFHALVD